MVSKWWMRAGRVHGFRGKARINRKFTPNQIKRVFRKFSAI